MSTLSRRALIGGGIAVAALAVVLGASGLSKWRAASSLATELMRPSELPEIVIGDAKAPVTIVEYASMTCGHCAHFHNAVLPELKAKLIDTGKVQLIYREFPLDNLAMAAAMMARCAGGDKTPELIKDLFAKQNDWAFVQGNPVPALFKIAEAHGFTKESFDKCLTDQKMLDGITGTRDRANKALGVRSTPTFFINGKKLADRADQIESFDKAIEPLLKQ